MMINERPVSSKANYRRVLGFILAGLIGLTFFGVSKGLTQLQIPDVPLFVQPFGVWGTVIAGLTIGAIAGLLCAWTDASMPGIILSSIFLAFIMLAVNLLTIDNPDTNRGSAIFVSFLFILPFAGAAAIAMILFRGLVNYQTDRRKYMIGNLRQFLMPVIVLAGVAAAGWLSMLPQNGRDVLTRMHQLLEDPAKPVQTLMLDGKESEYLVRVDMPYELEWETRNLDRFYLYVSGEAAGNASVVITHFEDGWKLACLFANVSSDPSCKAFNYPQ